MVMAALGGVSRRSARVRATPGSVSGCQRVCEFVRCKRRPKQALRRALWKCSELAMAGGAASSGGTLALAWPGT